MVSFSGEGAKGLISDLNLFPVSKDKDLGEKVKNQLDSDSSKDIISRNDAPKTYKMLTILWMRLKIQESLNIRMISHGRFTLLERVF